MKKLLGTVLFGFTSLAYAQHPAFVDWSIDKTREKWNQYAVSFAPNFQISKCLPTASSKGMHQNYNCYLPEAPSAALMIEMENQKTKSLWLTFNSHKSLEKPGDVLRIPALLTKVSRDVDYGDHLAFVKKVTNKIIKEKGSVECLVDSASNAKFCGTANEEYQFDYMIELAK